MKTEVAELKDQCGQGLSALSHSIFLEVTALSEGDLFTQSVHDARKVHRLALCFCVLLIALFLV